MPNTVIENTLLSPESMGVLSRFVHERTGIVMADAHHQILQSKLAARLKHLNIEHFQDYFQLLQRNCAEEVNYLINASTVNFTSFLREKDTFHRLTDQLLPQLLGQNAAHKRLRVWSAACSTGEEAYTLAIVLKEALEASPEWDIKVLATDLDTDALAVGNQGIYRRDRIGVFNPIRQERWFEAMPGEPERVRVRPELRRLVEFRHANLNGSWDGAEKMDIIFCRNVLIYFDQPTRMKLVQRFAERLQPRGWLIIGRSESIYGYSGQLEMKGESLYQLR